MGCQASMQAQDLESSAKTLVADCPTFPSPSIVENTVRIVDNAEDVHENIDIFEDEDPQEKQNKVEDEDLSILEYESYDCCMSNNFSAPNNEQKESRVELVEMSNYDNK